MKQPEVKQYPLSTVGGLVIAPDQTFLLVKSHKWTNHYTIPGGKIEYGETREHAVIREILEETGLKVSFVKFAQVQECIYSEEFWQKKHFIMNDFIAMLSSESSKTDVVLNDEAQEYVWVNLEDARKLPLSRETKILLDWYEAHQKKCGCHCH